MDIKDILYKNLEFYLNAIIGFSAIQGLGYLYYFGSNRVFYCYVKSAHYLAEYLVFLFIAIGFLAFIALIKIGRSQAKLANNHVNLFKSIMYSKAFVSLLFFILPATITFSYAVLMEAPESCKNIIG